MTLKGEAIAVIDDDAAVCDSTRFLLEAYDFAVQTYQSGAEFLKEEPVVACLIVDYQMPRLNGLDLVRELRKRGGPVPRIIMITATSDPTVEQRAAALGIQRVLQKPLSTQVLLNAIRERSS